ncbi:hypothetical protein [Microbispora sp. ATCC PTA-5024]|uniref:hypothetical protein n=1 Tax=Microbispora sp. ATCC PTA-5024 TaxID=316330 RepID=UPI0003DD22E6|nr:hypothetical protein [Microbispora sp. ATCC PTA-5024]ETK34978.1 hypothetical protein MPTA5024_16535 [Microbispora sp. ATCC PTA-5024]
MLSMAAVLLLAAESAPAGTVSTEPALDCGGFGHGTVRELSPAEKDFLCHVRGYDVPYAEPAEGWGDVADREVLAQGHQLCDLAARHGGDLRAPAVEEAPQASLGPALAALCPAVARFQDEQERQREAENDAYVDGAVELLVMVFPGTGRPTVVHR